MATLTRITPRGRIVPMRTIVDDLFDASVFAPDMLDRWFNRNGATYPANLVETNEEYLVQVALPGLKNETIEIQATNRALRIKAEYAKTEVESGTVIWNGLPEGEYVQTFTLPREVSGDSAEANYTNGVLNINFPRSDRVKVKNIPVKTTV